MPVNGTGAGTSNNRGGTTEGRAGARMTGTLPAEREPGKTGREQPGPVSGAAAARRAARSSLLLLAALWLLTRLLAERLWWTNLLLYLPQAVFLLVPLAPLLLAARRRDARAAVLCAAGLLAVAWLCMGWCLPLSAALGRAGGAADHPRVRVLAYNVHGATSGFRRLHRQIERYRPDVLVLSEALGWGNEEEMLAHLRMWLPGWSLLYDGDLCVAARWPEVERETGTLGYSDDRRKLRMLVEAPFGRFHVAGVHFTTAIWPGHLPGGWSRLPLFLRHTASLRRAQVEDVASWLERRPEPVILAGDFNTPPAGEVYRRLRGSFGDAFAEAGRGWGFTFPATRPLLRIDYVFHSRHWTALHAETGGGGSDHLPVFAELALTSR
jgi:vancomycin resistance protein VanJ